MTLEEVAYEESRRALEVQKLSLSELRTRAGTLLAVAALVTTFFGGEALEGTTEIACEAQVAIGAFIALAVLAVAVLLPWPFNWSLDPCALVNDYVDQKPQPPIAEMLRDLALHHDQSRNNNDSTITWLYWAFRIAAVLLAVEVVAWLLAL